MNMCTSRVIMIRRWRIKEGAEFNITESSAG